MFSRWLYSPRNYIMSILMVLAVYGLALEELTYSGLGRVAEGKIASIEGGGNDGGSGADRVVALYHYEFTDAKTGETRAGVIRGAGWNRGDTPWKVGSPVLLQYVSGWDSWSRLADRQKPWLGWSVLIGSCILFVVAVRFGREANDPFREAREKRLGKRQ